MLYKNVWPRLDYSLEFWAEHGMLPLLHWPVGFNRPVWLSLAVAAFYICTVGEPWHFYGPDLFLQFCYSSEGMAPLCVLWLHPSLHVVSAC